MLSPKPDIAPDTVSALYRQHHGWLVQFLRRRLSGDHQHALDLAHDTFERVMRTGIAKVPVEPRGYLATIAQRLTIDQFRRHTLEQAYLDSLACQPETLAPSPETTALMLEALAAVCTMLDAMPSRMRRIFMLAQIDGASYQDIAAQLEISVNIVQKDMLKAWQHCYAAIYG
ncbi:sigma-70 family RNA polymerase sigma factor [Corticimicrobacter populi]|uniref:RNA polymerase subunit sigma n=1 Tax=Corticimicrobacter populi TaxID=2175229 RepID=A0A2V1JX47_9BURK|nr:sigma-70 family RNA polymerase sigma factor [Corticimicrobacter populi]PWF21473.1 RNA polymerase subunit sigma [Corticimicrobacter populi]